MNRKLVLGLSVLVPVLYLGLTWGSGRMTHSQLEAWRERSATQLPILKVADVKIRHGLFSSSEEVTYELDFAAFRDLLEKNEEARPHPASMTAEAEPFRF